MTMLSKLLPVFGLFSVASAFDAAAEGVTGGRKMLAANIAPYRQVDAVDLCANLQKRQCLADSNCMYTKSVDKTFEHGTRGSGSGCSTKSAYRRVTNGDDGTLSRPEINRRLAEFECHELFSEHDCNNARQHFDKSCVWNTCWATDFDHCIIASEVEACPEKPEPKYVPWPEGTCDFDKPEGTWLWTESHKTTCDTTCASVGKTCVPFDVTTALPFLFTEDPLGEGDTRDADLQCFTTNGVENAYFGTGEEWPGTSWMEEFDFFGDRGPFFMGRTPGIELNPSFGWYFVTSFTTEGNPPTKCDDSSDGTEQSNGVSLNDHETARLCKCA